MRALPLLAVLVGLLPLSGWASDAHRHPRSDEMERARHEMAHHMGGQSTTALFVDRLEYQRHDGDGALVWEIDAWHGGDIHRLWFKSEGERSLDPAELEDAEIELRYGRAISPFFDLQAGVRRDFGPGPSRSHLALGVHGLAPYWFEVDAAAYLSERGDLTAKVEAEYEVLLTQRLILQPRLEVSLAAQDVPELEIGSGLGAVDAGLRLRYDIRRNVAPYVGVSRHRAFGETRDLLRLAGRETEGTVVVAGVRIWF